MKAVLISLILALSVGIFAAEPTPEFTLKDLQGNAVSLSDFKGKIVVIDFWAMWCKSCKEAFPELNSIASEYDTAQLNVVGIDLEKANPQKVGAFVAKAKIIYKILLDPEMATAKQFGVKGVPSLLVVGRDGAVVKMFRGMNKSTGVEVKKLIDSLIAAK